MSAQELQNGLKALDERRRWLQSQLRYETGDDRRELQDQLDLINGRIAEMQAAVSVKPRRKKYA